MTTKQSKKLKRARSFFIWALILAVITGMFAGCGKETAKEEPPKDVVRIAVMEPLTGEDSEKAEAEMRGIALANRMRSYVLDKKIELVYVDNKSTLAGAKAAAETVAEKSCIAALGSYGNMLTLAAVETLEDAGIPLINITGTNPLLSGGSDFVFCAATLETDQATAIGNYMKSQKIRSVAALIPYGDNYAASLTDMLGEVLGYSVPVVTYLPGNEDYSVQLDALRSCGVTAVFLPGAMEDVAKFLEQADNRWMFFGTEKLKTEEFLQTNADVAEGVYVTGEWDPEISYTGTSDVFLEIYRIINGEKAMPSEAEAFAYEAYMVLLSAIERAAEQASDTELPTGKSVRDALLETAEFNGVTGVLSVSESGSFNRSETIWKVVRGAYVNVKSITREVQRFEGDEQ